MTDPAEPWRGPHVARESEWERRARELVDRTTRVHPDPSAPRDSAAYRAAVARDLIGRGVSHADAAVLVLLETSWPGAGTSAIVRQAGEVAEQQRARARERESLAREIDGRERER